MSGPHTLVLGGTASGKSAHAEALIDEVARDSDVVYVATAGRAEDDPDLAARIERHRARRPTRWTTVECASPSDLARTLVVDRPVLVDSLGSWVGRFPGAVVDAGALDALVQAIRRRSSPTVLVSDEVGLAVHAPTAMGRRFADELGSLNQAVAAVCDDVVLVVAGRPLRLPSA